MCGPERVQELLNAASPEPYFLDGFDLHDAGTWLIAVLAREGNPSYKSDPDATKRLVALAPTLAHTVLTLTEALSRCANVIHERTPGGAESGATLRQARAALKLSDLAEAMEGKGRQFDPAEVPLFDPVTGDV